MSSLKNPDSRSAKMPKVEEWKAVATEWLNARGLGDLSLYWPTNKPIPQVDYESGQAKPTLIELLADFAQHALPERATMPEKPEKCPTCGSESRYHKCIIHPAYDAVGEAPASKKEVMPNERPNEAANLQPSDGVGAAHPNQTQVGEAGQVGEGAVWRVGRHFPINVYEGDRPICQCQTALDAKRIVQAVNAQPSPSALKEAWEAGADF